MPVNTMQEQQLQLTSILDFAARWHPEQQVITKSVEDGSVVVSNYAEIHRRSQCCAKALQNLGISKGDVVATLAWNTARHMECWYGIIGLGAICHTLNPRLSADDISYIANDAGDVILMTDSVFAGLMEKIVPNVPKVKCVVFLTDRQHMPKPNLAVPYYCYEDLIAAAAPSLPFKWVPVHEKHPCGMCYTSGTTGRPKGVVYSHRSNYLHALAASSSDVMPMGASATVLAVVPMFHANSWGLVFSAPMFGSRLVLPGPHLSGESLYQLMETQGVQITAGVPTVWMQLLNYVGDRKLRFSTLKYVAIAGSAAPVSLIERFMSYNVDVRHVWGMTEISPLGTVGALKQSLLDRMAELRSKGDAAGAKALELASHASQGRSHVFCDMRIVTDPDPTTGKTVELPHDGKSMGQLQVRGPIAIRAYHKNVEPGQPGYVMSSDGTAGGGLLPAVDEDGWFSTGDMASIDKYGHMRITDRSKDAIKSGGEWISSVDIENSAMGFAGVFEAAAVAIPDAHWGERPLLAVHLKPGVVPGDGLVKTPGGDSAEEKAAEEFEAKLLEYLSTKLAKFAVPDGVVFVKEIPHNATGKISKLVLRQQLEGYKPKPKKGGKKASQSKL